MALHPLQMAFPSSVAAASLLAAAAVEAVEAAEVLLPSMWEPPVGEVAQRSDLLLSVAAAVSLETPFSELSAALAAAALALRTSAAP